jgi:RNA polymerase sigma factor (sigma-70 family)
MQEHDWLAAQFETHREHLRAVAYRMLGSLSDADDAVQASWINLSRSDTNQVENIGGWMTTIVSRICLDMLRARRSRPEAPSDLPAPETVRSADEGTNPEREAQLADSVGIALMVVLNTLAPDERLVFVLHDVFAIPFDAIAPIVGRSSATTRQLASRARRRIRGVAAVPSAEVEDQREIVNAFLTAAPETSIRCSICSIQMLCCAAMWSDGFAHTL